MKLSRVRSADWLAGIGGLVLFVSLWLHWYGIDPSAFKSVGGEPPAATHFLVSGDAGVLSVLHTFAVSDATAWQAFSELDVLLALLALPAIGVPISAALSKVPTAPVAFTVVSTCASFLAVLLVLFRIVNQPGSNELVAVKYGAWIGLAGAVLAFVGSWLAMADEHTPGAVPPRLPIRPAP
jgi:hypothetical protein